MWEGKGRNVLPPFYQWVSEGGLIFADTSKKDYEFIKKKV